MISTDKHKKEALDGITTKFLSFKTTATPETGSCSAFRQTQSKGRRTREGRQETWTYVSVSLSYRISSTVAPSSYSKKHNIAVRLVNQRGTPLSDLTKKRRKPCSGDCQSKLRPAPEICRKSHVIYLATCDRCGKRHVHWSTTVTLVRLLSRVCP